MVGTREIIACDWGELNLRNHTAQLKFLYLATFVCVITGWKSIGTAQFTDDPGVKRRARLSACAARYLQVGELDANGPRNIDFGAGRL